MHRMPFAALALVAAVAPPAAADVGDPQVRTDHPWYPGELSCSTFERLFATQAGVAPPRFVLFTTGPLDAGYQRFIERKLREEFGFEGSPIEVAVKPRKKLGPGGRGKAHG